MDNELRLFAMLRAYVDQAEHSIRDQDWPNAVNRLKDCQAVIQALQNVCALPAACQKGFSEIWQ